MSNADASLVTETLVRADLRGCHSHGVMRVPEYVQKLTVDGVDPQGRPELMRQDGVAMVIDGHNAMGQIGGVDRFSSGPP